MPRARARQSAGGLLRDVRSGDVGIARPRFRGRPAPQRAARGVRSSAGELQELAHAGLEHAAERADLVVAGCAILETIMDLWPAERLGIADRGIREGILKRLMGAARV